MWAVVECEVIVVVGRPPHKLCIRTHQRFRDCLITISQFYLNRSPLKFSCGFSHIVQSKKLRGMYGWNKCLANFFYSLMRKMEMEHGKQTLCQDGVQIAKSHPSMENIEVVLNHHFDHHWIILCIIFFIFFLYIFFFPPCFIHWCICWENMAFLQFWPAFYLSTSCTWVESRSLSQFITTSHRHSWSVDVLTCLNKLRPWVKSQQGSIRMDKKLNMWMHP